MDYDLSRWLKDELGLVHSCESDLSDIVLHPRQGTLMRKFVEFVAKSSLCRERHPDVFAEEENFSSGLDLKRKCQERDQLRAKLKSSVRDNIILERKICGAGEKLEILRKVKKNQLDNINRLEQIAKRSFAKLEQVAERMVKAGEYLNEDPLAEMFKHEIEFASDITNDGPITSQQVRFVDEALERCKEKIDINHDTISRLVAEIKSKNLKLIGESGIRLKEKIPQGEPQWAKLVVLEPEAGWDEDEPDVKRLEEERERLMKEEDKLKDLLSQLMMDYDAKKKSLESGQSNRSSGVPIIDCFDNSD